MDAPESPAEVISSQSGTLRSTREGKIDYSLMRDGPMYRRWAVHLSLGGASSLEEPRIYPARNWLQASTQEDLDRFREGAARHFEQWFNGENDEDHAAAVIFNMNGVEHIKARLTRR